VITALLLDVDDTLIDTRAAMVAAGEAATAELWPQGGPEMLHAAGVRFHGDPGGFFGRFTRGELSFAQMRKARVADLLESFSLAATDEVCRQFEEVYVQAFSANVRLFDDVLPFLAAVGGAGIPMGLLTNSSADYTRQKLETTGLAGVFSIVVTRDTLGFGKPDSRAFQHACHLLGAAPSETVHVGDHLEIDAIAARDAGLGAVWLQRDSGDPGDPLGNPGPACARAQDIAVVSSLSQVPVLLTAP
jgi:putative hydrolase of the HAD superfamily